MANADIILLILTLFLESWVCGLLLKRGLGIRFPFFFSYIVASTAGDLAKLIVGSNYYVYFFVYWGFEALLAVMALLALHEAFRRVFKNFFAVFPWFTWLFPSVVALMVMLATSYVLQRPAKQEPSIIRLILAVEIGIYVIQAGLFLLFRGAAWFFHARRRNYATGIVDGFAVLAAAGLIYGLRSEFGTRLALLVQYGVPVAYIVAQIIWLDTFLRAPEPAPRLPKGMTLEQALDEMAQNREWAKELSRRIEKR